MDGAFTCSACPSGYSGDGYAGCVDVDECLHELDDCSPLVTCANTDGGFACAPCPAGYEGDGRVCRDIDECANGTHECDARVTCTNVMPGYVCGACPAGFAGDGRTCVDVDECTSEPCDPLTSCENLEGTYACSGCPAGYVGDGYAGCVDVDECAVENGNCGQEAACVNNAGGRLCRTCEAASVGQPVTCGVGACAASGVTSCALGEVVDVCTPGVPAADDSTCNGIDDDCNSTADDGYVNAATRCGVGACAATGLARCVGGQVLDSCTPGQPAANDQSCDGVDDDCDGQSDEHFVPSAATCGVGACERSGVQTCEGGRLVAACTPGQPAPSDSACNGVDEDCDGAADEDYQARVSQCGVGACAATGIASCVSGSVVDSCTPRPALGADTTCDGVDDDCDGAVDDDFHVTATTCVAEGCEAAGSNVCRGGQIVNTCASEPQCLSERACGDGADNDNDGAWDCADSDCAGIAPCVPELCGNSLDDDGDGRFDCGDADCASDSLCALPPAPEEVAPALPRTGVPSTYDSVRFIYEGSDPIQRDVAPNTIQPLRATVIRGRVSDANGAALWGVRVALRNHAELGHTLTRGDGAYDLVVNGGEQLVVELSHPLFLPVHRAVTVRWNEITWVPDVVMTDIDPAVTRVELNGSMSGIQTAVGSASVDGSGARTPVLMFPAGVAATMTLSDGTIEPLTAINVRATEYTVGPLGLLAMPSELAPNTAYTYAVELSADEALAAGAAKVSFSAPVPLYIDNFLNFPVGTLVPTGYYDRASARWFPSKNGRVVKVVGKASDKSARLDVTGDGVADTTTTLQALGISTAELAELGRLYPTGKTLWRSPIDHFTPYDCNWPFFVPEDDNFTLPPEQDNNSTEEEDDCKDDAHSTIHCMNQAVSETLPVVGTDLSLTYYSGRAAETRRRAYDVVVTSDTPPSALLDSVMLVVTTAGQILTKRFGPEPNQSFHYEWDGRDGFGRTVTGTVTSQVQLCYMYQARYVPVAVSFDASTIFGQLAGSRIPNVTTTQPVRYPPETEAFIGNYGVCRGAEHALDGLSPQALWEIDKQLYQDPVTDAIYSGAGDIQRKAALPAPEYSTLGVSASQGVGPAASTPLVFPSTMTAAPDGSLLWIPAPANGSSGPGDVSTGQIFMLRNGTISKVSGQGTLRFLALRGLPLVLHEGWLYLWENGTSTTPLTNPPLVRYRFSTDLGMSGREVVIPNTGAVSENNLTLNTPLAVRAADVRIAVRTFHVDRRDGTLFFNISGRLIRLSEGVLTSFLPYLGGRVAGNPLLTGGWKMFEVGMDGTIFRIEADPASDISRNLVTSYLVEYTPSGERKLRTRFRDNVVASERCPFDSALLRCWPDALTIDPATGDLYMSVRANVLIGSVYNSADPLLYKYLMFRYPRGSDTPEPLAVPVGVGRPAALFMGPDGNLYATDDSPTGGRGSWLWGYTQGRARLVSAIRRDQYVDAADLAYTFTEDGRQTQSRDATTGIPLYNIEYGAGYRATAFVDAHGNRTRIERDSDGLVREIISPYGKSTVFQYDALKRLVAVTDPDGLGSQVTYHAGTQLMETFTNRGSITSHYAYDSLGRLTRDDDAEGFVQLQRTAPDVITKSDADGRSTTYSLQNDAETHTRSVVLPDGTAASTQQLSNGTTISLHADGTTVTQTVQPDPRLSGQVMPAEQTITLPSGLTARALLTRSVATDGSTTITSTVNGNAWTQRYVPSTRTWTSTSPEGRTSTRVLDAKGRPTTVTAPGSASSSLVYDAHGRLFQATTGSTSPRTISFLYDALGQVEKITSASQPDLAFGRDLLGRVTSSTRADQTVTNVRDALGRLTSLTLPDGQVHEQTYTRRNALKRYTPPAVAGANQPGSIDYTYTVMGEPLTKTLANGRSLSLVRDSKHRVSQMLSDHFVDSYEFNDSTGTISSIDGEDGARLSFTYDGPLVLETRWSGPVAGSVSQTYNASFAPSTVSVNGQQVAAFTYDRDGLLTTAGPLAVGRSPQTGQITGTTLGQATTAFTYNEHGEVKTFQAAVNGSVVFRQTATSRDGQGRLLELDEEVAGVGSTRNYSYDEFGRLEQVFEESELVSEYSYDTNGNRLRRAGNNASEQGVYDAQDRVQTYGACSYVHDAAGFLATRTCSGAETSFEYDVRGGLRRVTLTNGDELEYLIDPQGRRVGQRRNGTFETGWLYKDGLRPAAQLDATGAVRSVFVYGSQSNLPDYIYEPATGRSYQVIRDLRNSPRLVIDVASGAIVQRMDFDEFGRVLNDTNPGFQPFGFAGGLYDVDTGLVRYGARDYDAYTGRWTARDPMLFSGGQLNLYVYVGNDPINFNDPTGLCSSYWDRVKRNFKETNEMLPGALAPTGLGLLTGRAVASALGVPGVGTILQAVKNGAWAWGEAAIAEGMGIGGTIGTAAEGALVVTGSTSTAGLTGALGGAAIAATANFAATGMAWELGVGVGSLVAAALPWGPNGSGSDGDGSACGGGCE